MSHPDDEIDEDESRRGGGSPGGAAGFPIPYQVQQTPGGGHGANSSYGSSNYGPESYNSTYGSITDELDMVLSPTSTVSSGRNNAENRRGQASPLLGEVLLSTDTEEEAELIPTRLRLPPAAAGGLHQPHDGLTGLGGVNGGVSGVGVAYGGINIDDDSPSSTKAQPGGDWSSSGGMGYGGGGAAGFGGSSANGGAAGGGVDGPSYARGFASFYRGTRGGPFATFVRVAVVVAVLAFTAVLAVVLSNYSAGGAASGGGSSSAPNGGPMVPSAAAIPFPHVDRSTYGDPAGKIVDPELFEPRLLCNPPGFAPDDSATSANAVGTDKSNGTDATGGGDRQRRTRRRRAAAVDGEQTSPSSSSSSPAAFLKVPFPTGAFWTNLVLKPTTDRGLSYPIVSYPYAYKWSPSTLVASYPTLRRKIDDTSIRDTFNPDLVFTSAEAVAKRHVVAFDPLSVTVRFLAGAAGDRTSYWESYIVRGSPYVTIKYKSSTPVVTPPSTFQNVMCPRDSDGKYKDAKEYENNSKPPGAGGEGGDSGGGKRITGSWGVCSSEGGESESGEYTTLTGVQFLLQTQENLTWMVFASSPISIRFDKLRKKMVQATKPFSGVLRFALVPPPSDDSGSTDTGVPGFHNGVQLSSSSGVRRLIYHASVYPVGGSVSWEFQDGSSSPGSKIGQAITGVVGGVVGNPAQVFSSGTKEQLPPRRSGTIKFQFDTVSMADASDETNRNSYYDQLLMLALPHHAELMESGLLKDDELFDLEYHCIKGRMRPVVGDSWEYREALPTTGFDDTVALQKVASMDSGVRKTILDQVGKDMKLVLPTFDENVYGFGKQVARLAQLVHIGHTLSPQTAGGSSGSKGNAPYPAKEPFVQDGLDTLQKFISTFLRDGQKDKLMFDANFGGIVTKDGLKDTQADFGNGRFNDHHFHYGYMLYACAIMGRYNSTFVSEYGSYVDALLFDVAYSSNSGSVTSDDNFFPMSRHVNWYDGHSFASGLFPYGNGKSQESSSEAVNCYYGAYLWSMIRWGDSGDGGADGKGGADFARLLLAMEIRGARTYWHMTPPVGDSNDGSTHLDVYQPSFTKNYMVGNLGMTDAVCSTWFGTSKLYVHMINFVPLTAITGTLFDRDYVQGEFTNIIKPLYSGVEMSWKGYVVGDRAIIDPNGAWKDALKLISYELDAALSLSQLLYFISTRKDFDASTSSNSTAPEEDASTYSFPSSACEANPKCVSLGLSGECCPAASGAFLGCCDESTSTSSEPAPTPSQSSNNTKPADSSSSSSCEAKPKCIELGLSGECCPTAGGAFLGCCESAGSSSEPQLLPQKSKNNTTDKTPSEQSTGVASACEENESCADLGHSGQCCPTDRGDFLGCCGQERL